LEKDGNPADSPKKRHFTVEHEKGKEKESSAKRKPMRKKSFYVGEEEVDHRKQITGKKGKSEPGAQEKGGGRKNKLSGGN